MTGLQYDPNTATRELSRADRTLGRLIRRAGEFRLSPERLEHSPFEALMRAIIYQQLSGKAAATIYSRVLALLAPAERPTPGAILAVDPEDLRAAGMSRAKVAGLRDLAEKTLDGTVPELTVLEAMDDEEIIRRLTAVRGIGRWTVEMLLIFRLGRPDVLPVHDLGVGRGYMLAYRLDELPAPKDLERRGERWRPYRSVASWYLWQAVHLSRGEA